MLTIRATIAAVNSGAVDSPAMKRRLVTSALPYVNNLPHLGNLIQVLSADVFARFCRLAGYQTLYICGTDEYGTATETRAMEEGISPRELVDRFHAIHRDIYGWFNISFDRFGRTSTSEHTRITQEIFLQLHANGLLQEREIEQLYSETSKMFLADRFVRGTCPNCGYGDARGDQCENCGKLLDPADLIDPRSAIDGSTPVPRKTTHLYIDLPAIKPRLDEWMQEASVRGRWSRNAIQMTQAWIRDGLRERSITRDLKWGIPVPLPGYEDKVIYVWFDAPIGYVSITAGLTEAWEEWWKNPEDVELFQFIGKDNIPFHTVIFPSSLLGSGENWTMLHHMSSTEYLNYENAKFSKSKGIGVFGDDAMESGIPADVWRFYIFYNRPETSDYTFTWPDFQERVNGELIGNFANLVNRTLTFLTRYFDGAVLEPEHRLAPGTPGTVPEDFHTQRANRTAAIRELHEWAGLREALRQTLELSRLGNQVFQAAEPWRVRKDEPHSAHSLVSELTDLLRDLAILMEPYIPQSAGRLMDFLRMSADARTWDTVGRRGGIDKVNTPDVLFQPLDDELVSSLRRRYAGSQAERAEAARDAAEAPEDAVAGSAAHGTADQDPADRFAATVELRVARIESVAQHPDADRLYVEQMDDGRPEPRQVVSGLVGFYRPEDLAGRHVILVDNLKPAKLRGVKSEGMLLAASSGDGEARKLEVLFVDHLQPGTVLKLEGREALMPPRGEGDKPRRITVDDFFAIPIRAQGGEIRVGGSRLLGDGEPIRTATVLDGEVG